MARRTAPKAATALPDFVKEEDKKGPDYKSKIKILDYDMAFIHSERFGWIVKTLPINARTGRSYGMTLDGSVVTCGGRPDDYEKTIRIVVTDKNQARLAKWVEAKAKGMGTAGDIRDRIGSRRAQGQEMRAQGRRSWRWDV
jgi:hypothetical protein